MQNVEVLVIYSSSKYYKSRQTSILESADRLLRNYRNFYGERVSFRVYSSVQSDWTINFVPLPLD